MSLIFYNLQYQKYNKIVFYCDMKFYMWSGACWGLNVCGHSVIRDLFAAVNAWYHDSNGLNDQNNGGARALYICYISLPIQQREMTTFYVVRRKWTTTASSEKNYCWWLTFWDPERKSSSECEWMVFVRRFISLLLVKLNSPFVGFGYVVDKSFVRRR